MLQPINVLVANICGEMADFEGRKEIFEEMRKAGVKKEAGWSRIELNGKHHTFHANDMTHPKIEEIRTCLKYFGEIFQGDYSKYVRS